MNLKVKKKIKATVQPIKTDKIETNNRTNEEKKFDKIVDKVWEESKARALEINKEKKIKEKCDN